MNNTFQDTLGLSFDSNLNLWVLEARGWIQRFQTFVDAKAAYNRELEDALARDRECAADDDEEEVVGFGDHVPAFFLSTPVGSFKKQLAKTAV